MNALLARLWNSRFLRFSAVGAAGFLVNEAALFVALKWLSFGRYGGAVFSFFVAVTFTWWGNRMLTFHAEAATAAPKILEEWAKFVVANGLGFLANYAVYAALVTFAPEPLGNPFFALACGTVVGILFNFTLSKRAVFRAPTS